MGGIVLCGFVWFCVVLDWRYVVQLTKVHQNQSKSGIGRRLASGVANSASKPEQIQDRAQVGVWGGESCIKTRANSG